MSDMFNRLEDIMSSGRPQCTVKTFLLELDEETVAEYREAMDMRRGEGFLYPASAFSRLWREKHDVRLSEGTIQRHRRRACRCA